MINVLFLEISHYDFLWDGGVRFQGVYLELPVHISSYKKAPVLFAGAYFESWWRRGRVELPVQKKLSRIYYKLGQLFNLTGLASTDRVGSGQPVNLSSLLPALKRRHPGFSAPNPGPSGWGWVGWQPS